MAAPTRLIRFLDRAGSLCLGDCAATAMPTAVTLVHGCGPHRPGAARGLKLTDERADIAKLLSPVPMPPAVMCIGLNYRRHAEETRQAVPRFPVVFYKNPASVCGPEDSIVVPNVAAEPLELDYECELAVVIGPRPVRNVAPEDALGYCWATLLPTMCQRAAGKVRREDRNGVARSPSIHSVQLDRRYF